MDTLLTSIPVITPIQDPPFQVDAALYFLRSGDYLFKNFTGGQSSKFVTALDVQAAFSRKEQDTGWIPAGVVRRGYCTAGPFFVYAARPEKATIQVEGANEPLTIPIPFTVMLGMGRDYYLWALHARTFDPQAQAYQAPFPNIHPDGKICWGQNAAPQAGPEKAGAAWSLFFTTAFNADLAGGKSRKYKNDVRDQLRRLAETNAKIYPADDLVYQSSSIGELIERTLGR